METSSAGTEILIVLLLIIANGIFSMSEAAVISSRKVRLQQRAEAGDKSAKAALELANSPNNFLATVQIGITVIGILTGAFGGATIADSIRPWINQIAVLRPYSGALSLAIVVLLIAYFSLIIGELVPKNLALNNPERIAALLAGPMQLLSRLTRPLVWFLSASTSFVTWLLGVKPSTDAHVTEEEIKVMIDQSTQAGEFEEVERQMVSQLFRLGDLVVGELMTPRPDIVWLDIDDTREEARKKIAQTNYSRYPVAHNSLDNVLGVVRAKDLLLQQLRGDKFDVHQVMQSPLYVPESMTVFKLLELFKESRVHIALVIDEFGGLQGLLTMNDILEEIASDVLNPAEGETEAQITRRADGSLLLDGMLPIDMLKQALGVKTLPDEDSGNYRTLAGFVMMQLGRIPIASDTFDFDGRHFEVMDMDRHRIDKVLVTTINMDTPTVDVAAPAASAVPAAADSKN